MAADDFFSRWSKPKPAADAVQESRPLPASGEESGVPPVAAPAEPALPPTLEDVAALTHDSDFSRFVGRDVDDAVKRSALKKLFSNPHFNVMDGLDVYIDDYNKFTPLPPSMLASLNHAKDLLNPTRKQTQANVPNDEGATPGSVPGQAEAADMADAPADGKHANDSEHAEGGEQLAHEQDGDMALSPVSSVSPDTMASDTDAQDKSLSQGGS